MLYLEACERTTGAKRMSRCKEAERLEKIVDREAEKATFTGYYDDFADAYDEYVNHIQDHGCWRGEP
jgi:hypothetical protein